MVESVSGDATVRKEQWQLTGTVEVYGNKSRITVEVTQTEENCSELRIKINDNYNMVSFLSLLFLGDILIYYFLKPLIG